MSRDVEVQNAPLEEPVDVLNTSFDTAAAPIDLAAATSPADQYSSSDLNVTAYSSSGRSELLELTKQHREYVVAQELGVTVSRTTNTQATIPQNREITEEQRQELTAELRKAAIDLADKDHRRSPNAKVDQEALQGKLKEILENAARQGVPLTDELVQDLAKSFQESYESSREKLFKDMPWYKRGYYNVTGFLSGCGSAISSAFNYVKDSAITIGKAAYKLATETDWKEVGKTVIEGIGTGLAAVRDGAIALTKGETWQAIGSGIATGWNATVDFVTSEQTWRVIGNGIMTGLEWAGSAVVEVGKLGLEALNPVNWANGIATAASWAGQLVSDPSAAWNSLCEGCSSVWESFKASNIGGAIVATGSFIYDVSESVGINSLVRGAAHLSLAPFEAIYNTGAAVLKTGWNMGKVLTGQMSLSEFGSELCENCFNVVESYFSRIGKGLESIKGAALLVGELTGITDLCLMAHHSVQFLDSYVNNDKAGMVMHGSMVALHGACAAMSIGAIAATVATAGAAAGTIGAAAAGRMGIKAAAKKIMTTVAKNFVKETAEAMGKEVVTRLGKELTTEVMESTAREIAQEGGKELAERIAKDGAQVLTNEVKQVMADVSEKATEKMLRNADLVQHVDDVVSEMLEDLSSVSVKELTQRLEKQGVENAASRAKEIKKLIKNGKADHELKQILEDEITTAVCKHLEEHMEVAFKTEFRAMLDGTGREALQEMQERMLKEAGVEAREQLPRRLQKEYDELGERIKHCEELEKAAKEEAERLGKELDEYIDETVEKGWEGVKEGMQKAVRKLVREGIERAFKRFRTGKARPVTSAADSTRTVNNVVEEKRGERQQQSHDFSASDSADSEVKIVDENRAVTRTETVTNPDGSITTYHFQFDPELNAEVLINTSIQEGEKESTEAGFVATSDENMIFQAPEFDLTEANISLATADTLQAEPVRMAEEVFLEQPATIPFPGVASGDITVTAAQSREVVNFEERVADIAADLDRRGGVVGSVEEATERFTTRDHAAMVAKVARDLEESENAA